MNRDELIKDLVHSNMPIIFNLINNSDLDARAKVLDRSASEGMPIKSGHMQATYEQLMEHYFDKPRAFSLLYLSSTRAFDPPIIPIYIRDNEFDADMSKQLVYVMITDPNQMQDQRGAIRPDTLINIDPEKNTRIEIIVPPKTAYKIYLYPADIKGMPKLQAESKKVIPPEANEPYALPRGGMDHNTYKIPETGIDLNKYPGRLGGPKLSIPIMLT